MREARHEFKEYFTEETKQHCERVANYAGAMCEYLKLPDYDQIVITSAAKCHDIGKYFIPKDILNAPRALTKLEREVIDMHSYYGYELCKELTWGGKDEQELILLHHGMHKYRKLSDGQIGDFAKKYYPILIATDMYDALTTDRVYRDAMDRETALQVVAENQEVYLWVFEALEAVTEKEKNL